MHYTQASTVDVAYSCESITSINSTTVVFVRSFVLLFRSAQFHETWYVESTWPCKEAIRDSIMSSCHIYFNDLRHTRVTAAYDDVARLSVYSQQAKGDAAWLSTQRRQNVCHRGDRELCAVRCTEWRASGVRLGPILFVMYTADVVSIIERHGLSAHQYADDTQVYGRCSPNDFTSLTSHLGDCIEQVAGWMSRAGFSWWGAWGPAIGVGDGGKGVDMPPPQENSGKIFFG